MARQAVAFGSTEQRSNALDGARLVNLFPEQPPLGSRAPGLQASVVSAPVKSVLYGTPGQKAFVTCGSGRIRAMHVFGGFLWVVSDGNVYRVDSSGNITLCTNAVNPTGTCIMSDNGFQVVILSGIATYVVGSNVSTWAFTITGGTYATGTNQIADVKINSSAITTAAVDWTGSNAQTAANVAANIAANSAISGYTATVNGPTVIVQATTAGTSTNGKAAVADVAGNVTVSSNASITSGGASATTTIVQVQTNYPAVGASSMDVLDGFTVWSQTNSQQWFCSNLFDATAINALNFNYANTTSSNILRVLVNLREIWIFKPDNIEVWDDVGSFPFPFARNQSAVFERGCAAGLTCTKLDNSIFWLGDDLNVYRSSGYQPTRISHHGIEEIIRNINETSGVSDAFGMTYTQEGHVFYVMTFPAGGRTLVYDVATQNWHERQTGTTLAPTTWAPNCIARFNEKLFVGTTGGMVNELDLDTFTDNGSTIRRAAVTPPFYGDGKRTIMPDLELECELGVGQGVGSKIGGGPDSVGTALNSTFTVPLPGATGTTTFVSTTGFYVNAYAGITNAGVFLITNIAGSTVTLQNASTPGNPAPGTVISRFTQVSSQEALPLDPQAMLRWSDDGGATWSNQRSKSIGKVGQRRARTIFRRLGAFRQREYELSISDPVKIAIYGLRFDATALEA